MRQTEGDAANPAEQGLPRVGRLLTVCAHPDDESFGLGGLLAAFAQQGTRVEVLCFTRGEASTLGAGEGDLAQIRARELDEAMEALGVGRVELLAYADGRLDTVPLEELAAHVRRLSDEADALLVFDEGGITGHADHRRATEAALAGSPARLPVLAWAIPAAVTRQLNAEFSTGFVGRKEGEADFVLVVDRTRQLEAMSRHRSQLVGNPVPWRRLELQGDREWLVFLRGRPSHRPHARFTQSATSTRNVRNDERRRR